MGQKKHSRSNGIERAGTAAGHAARGSPSPVTAAFLECSAFLKKFLAGFLRVQQDIEDVAQEAYLRAYVAEQRESIEHPTPFLFRVAKNLALTHLTQKSRQITEYIEDAGARVVIDSVAGTDEEVEAQQCLGLYCEAIASLPEKCRQVFLLRKVHGLTHEEIGARMQLSVSSVEKYLRRGIVTCESYLRDHESPRLSDGSETRRGGGKVGS